MVGRRKGMLETAETDIWFDVEGEGLYYIDIAQCLSLMNRRFYRQGMQYVVNDMEVISDGVSELLVYRLPHTWVVASAWEKCMRNWKEQQDDAAEQAGTESLAARYRDFKVYMDSIHAQAGFASNALPRAFATTMGDGNGSALPTDVDYDWSVSEIVIPNDTTVGNTTERTFHMIGADTTAPTPDSAGMIHAYAESRARPHLSDPNTVGPTTNTGGILGEMFDVGDDDSDIIKNMRLENNEPPYPIGDLTSTEWYPGGSSFGLALTDVGFECAIINRSTAASGGSISTSYAPGFLASCGLVAVGVSHPSPEHIPTVIRFKLGIASGDYKGVAARSMAVVN